MSPREPIRSRGRTQKRVDDQVRKLNDEEVEWLIDNPLGRSHRVGGIEMLAACEECDFTAAADSFEYLMELVEPHLVDTYSPIEPEELEDRKKEFRQIFGWDPWQEGVIRAVESEGSPNTFDFLAVIEIDEDGEQSIETYVWEGGDRDSEEEDGQGDPRGGT